MSYFLIYLRFLLTRTAAAALFFSCPYCYKSGAAQWNPSYFAIQSKLLLVIIVFDKIWRWQWVSRTRMKSSKLLAEANLGMAELPDVEDNNNVGGLFLFHNFLIFEMSYLILNFLIDFKNFLIWILIFIFLQLCHFELF